MGLVVRSLHSVQHMLQSSMDQGQSVASFRREVTTLSHPATSP